MILSVVPKSLEVPQTLSRGPQGPNHDQNMIIIGVLGPIYSYPFMNLQWSFPEMIWHVIYNKLSAEADRGIQFFCIKPTLRDFQKDKITPFFSLQFFFVLELEFF